MRPYSLFVRLAIGIITVCMTASAAAARQRSDFGTLSIQVRPPDAEIFIDGERWTASDENAPLQVQLAPGAHRVEIRGAGRQTFSRSVTIRAGETTPLNVSLASVNQEPSPASLPPAAAGGSQPTTRSSEGTVHASTSEDGFMIAPDYRVTELNHHTAQLVGGYGGYVFGGQFLLGGGGYWQAQPADGMRIAYAGPVVEWRLFPDKTVGVNLHGLVGGGWRNFDDGYLARFDGPRLDRRDLRTGRALTLPFGFHNDPFFVAEPEAQLVLRLGSWTRLQVGGGYRATSVDGLSGASGSVSVQFGR